MIDNKARGARLRYQRLRHGLTEDFSAQLVLPKRSKVTDPMSELTVGTRVMHEIRGEGYIKDVDTADERSKPVNSHVYTRVRAHVCTHVYVHVDAQGCTRGPYTSRKPFRRVYTHVCTHLCANVYAHVYAHSCTRGRYAGRSRSVWRTTLVSFIGTTPSRHASSGCWCPSHRPRRPTTPRGTMRPSQMAARRPS